MKSIEADKKESVVNRVALSKDAAIASEPLAIDEKASGAVHVAADIDPVDVVDPSKEVTLELWVSDDEVGQRLLAACRYVGGAHKNKDAPGFFIDAEECAGRLLEVRIFSPKGNTKAGATIEHVTAKQVQKVIEV